MRSIARIFIGLTVLALGWAVASAPASARDHNCPDFSSQAAAQAYFDNSGYSASYDPERLDADHDGVACESNPCPCAAPHTQTPSPATTATAPPTTTTSPPPVLTTPPAQTTPPPPAAVTTTTEPEYSLSLATAKSRSASYAKRRLHGSQIRVSCSRVDVSTVSCRVRYRRRGHIHRVDLNVARDSSGVFVQAE